MTRICPCCGSSDWDAFLGFDRCGALTTDQCIVSHHLRKIICVVCGVVANAELLTGDSLRALYTEDYALNTNGHEEHIFFTPSGPIPRSKAVFDWIALHLPSSAKSVLEIGCGAGNVLQRFAGMGLAVQGIEASRAAVNFARAKGLDVWPDMIVSAAQRLPSVDAIYSYGVLEHVEDLDAFIGAIRGSMSSDGTVLIALPLQDHGSYDVFFADHVWHLTARHVQAALERTGLAVIHWEQSRAPNTGFGLFVCKAGANPNLATAPDVGDAPAIQYRNRDHWLSKLADVDAQLSRLTGKRVAVYGSGEVLGLLMAYTSLSSADIVVCLDEDANKIGMSKFGLPIEHPRRLADVSVDVVLLTVNPRYHDQIRQKLAPFAVDVVGLIS